MLKSNLHAYLQVWTSIDKAAMVLCGKCGQGYHTHCTDPPHVSLEGNWFCQGHEEDDDAERGESVSNLDVEGSEGVIHLQVEGSERNLHIDVVDFTDQNYNTTEQVRNNAFVFILICINLCYLCFP